MNKEPIIFIDTEDMEERYAEGLYMDYLKEENQQLKDRINKAIEYIEDSFENEYGMSKKELKTYNLKNCTYDASLVVLGILKGDE